MEKKYKVYKYTSPSNKYYIGQTCQTLETRALNGKGYHHSTVFYNAIQKYGFENFSCEILKTNLSLEEANYWEKYYINFYKSSNRKYGYNISLGGNNHNISPEARQKISQHMKDKNPMKNPKTAQKVQEKLKGRKLTNEQRQNMSQSHKKKILCIDTGQIFESRQAAAEFYHVSPSGIGRAAKGEQLTSAGKRWKYLK